MAEKISMHNDINNDEKGSENKKTVKESEVYEVEIRVNDEEIKSYYVDRANQEKYLQALTKTASEEQRNDIKYMQAKRIEAARMAYQEEMYLYAHMNAADRAEFSMDKARKMEAHKQKLQLDLELAEKTKATEEELSRLRIELSKAEVAAEEANEKQKADIRRKYRHSDAAKRNQMDHDKLEENREKRKDYRDKVKTNKEALEEGVGKDNKKLLKGKDGLYEKEKAATAAKAELDKLKKQGDKADPNKVKEAEEKVAKANKAVDDQKKKVVDAAKKNGISEEEITQTLEARDELANATDEEKGLTGNKFVDGFNQAGDKFNEALDNVFEDGSKRFAAAIQKGLADIDGAVSRYWEYMSSGAETRLWKTGKDFGDLTQAVKDAVGLSPLVKQEDVLKTLNEMIDQGIIYDLEERAFLATISDKIATTFDAFDSNLMRLIRLQQEDSTKARMGMESQLTQFLGEYFKDSSYMNKGEISDQISSTLIEAQSLMTKEQSTAFELTVQKWLGALYSVGMDEGTVKEIAEGVNMLASGNVEGLAGKENIQNLLAMSASRSNLSYAELLLEGLKDSSTTNTLLQNMVIYLQEIANTAGDNNVVKSSFGDVFGMKMSDIRAATNLTQEDIATISEQFSTSAFNSEDMYKGMLSQVYDMADTIYQRIDPSQILSNVYENFVWSTGETIASNAIFGIPYLINKQILDATGGINIPSLSAAGFGLDLEGNLNQIINLGLIGLGTLGSIGPMITTIQDRAQLKGVMDRFSSESTEMVTRGKGFESTFEGADSGLSLSSTMTTNASSDDMKTKSLTDATKSAEEDKEIVGAPALDHEDDRTAEHVYQKLFEDRSTPVRVEIVQSEDPLDVNVYSYRDIAAQTMATEVQTKLKPDLYTIIKEIMELSSVLSPNGGPTDSDVSTYGATNIDDDKTLYGLLSTLSTKLDSLKVKVDSSDSEPVHIKNSGPYFTGGF